ncbi:MAG: hypothetical protein ACREPL_01830 [Rhodanobacteraceae bacterium]
MRVTDASTTWKFRGKDEHEYIHDLYLSNTAFATSDRIFVNEILDTSTKHGGIIYVPNRSASHDLEVFAEVAGIFISAWYHQARYEFRGCTLYPTKEGLHLIRRRQESELVFSWLELFDEGDEQLI